MNSEVKEQCAYSADALQKRCAAMLASASRRASALPGSIQSEQTIKHNEYIERGGLQR